MILKDIMHTNIQCTAIFDITNINLYNDLTSIALQNNVYVTNLSG